MGGVLESILSAKPLMIEIRAVVLLSQVSFHIGLVHYIHMYNLINIRYYWSIVSCCPPMHLENPNSTTVPFNSSQKIKVLFAAHETKQTQQKPKQHNNEHHHNETSIRKLTMQTQQEPK